MSFPKQAVALCYGLFFLVLLSSCSSTALDKNNHPISTANIAYPDNSKLIEVPFFPQKKYHCGPAALAGIFNFYQMEIQPDAIADQIYLPERKGSLQIEIKAAARRADFLPYELSGGIENLLLEVDAGNPVLVLQNLAFSWKPQWHYAVVVGYDKNKQQVILHSGTHANYRLDISTFINTWQRADSWALVITPVANMPVTAEAKNYLREASTLESVGKGSVAVQAYQQALLKWPDNDLALIGMGNFYYQQQHYQQAVEAFLRVTQVQKNNPAAWNNLAYALQKQGCYDLSLQAAEQAVELASNKELYLESQQELQAAYIKAKVSNYCAALEL